jgi:hypothetical protein
MNDQQHQIHERHEHEHGPGCGHTAVAHEGHTDYLHDGHMHHPHEGHVDEHVFPVDATHPASCTPEHDCGAHESGHVHGAGCGHEQVPHGDHLDYLADGHLHHPHEGHCDHHGTITLAS